MIQPRLLARRRVLILSQVYVPDPASVGQHIHGMAAELARRGHNVVVHCSRRGYDDPTRHYAKHQTIDGVAIRRYGLPLFSKTSFLVRITGSVWAAASLFLAALFTPRVDLIFFSTSPPMVGFVATLAAKLRGVIRGFRRLPRVYWAMDLNPDQLIAMGKLRDGSMTHRLLEAVNRFILRNADLTVALDRFMHQRLTTRGRRTRDVLVMPPWPHEEVEAPLAHDQNHFRQRHDLAGRFLLMYSGNHSPANPLDTLLEATKAFAGDDRLCFAFIGGGTDKQKVIEFIAHNRLDNTLVLPYQPIDQLRYSLSAADVHVVSLGTDMVGIIHPCKVYGAMAVARPVLYLGPVPSHVSDLLETHQVGWSVSHGDVEGCIRAINRMLAATPQQLSEMGSAAQRALRDGLSRAALTARLCDAVEKVMADHVDRLASG